MRFVPRNSFLCDRGREWISLRLDGELSELAQKMLDSHLVRCEDCRDFEDQVSGIALQLRSAASVAVAAVGVVGFTSLPSSNTLHVAPLVVVAVPSGNEDLRDFREMRAAGLKPVVLPPPRDRGPQRA